MLVYCVFYLVLGGGGPDLQRLRVPPMMVAIGLCCVGL